MVEEEPVHPVQVSPDALDAVALLVKQETAVIDGVRLDLIARTGSGSRAVGVNVGHSGEDLLAVADRFLRAARDELAAMSEFANLAAAAARRADAGLGELAR